jgi:Na+/citrate or Na+/malate symporter
VTLNHKERKLKPLRRVRPRYKKALIPALIISLIIAIILILIFNKYVFKPIFEGRGLLQQTTPVVVMRAEDGSEERLNTVL